MQTYRIDNPDKRGDTIYLTPDAYTALMIWQNRWHNGLAAQGRQVEAKPLYDTNRYAAHSPVCAALSAYVEADVATWLAAPLVGGAYHRDTEEWAVAKRIQAEHDRLTPPTPPAPLPVDDSEACRHGVSFDIDCAKCAA